MSGPPPQWQFACAAYIPLLTANLSVVGSSLIIHSILRGDRPTEKSKTKVSANNNNNNNGVAAPSRKLHQPQHRILLAMSCCDVVYSLAKAWTFLLAPKGYGVPGAQGNLNTCALQGFIIQLFVHSTGGYTALLSIYYYLTICRGWKPQEFSKRVERLAHLSILGLFLTLAIVGVNVKLYNPVFGFCFIGSYPPGCERGEGTPTCDRFPPQQLGLLYEIFAQAWIQAFFVVIIFCQAAIWKKVREQETRNAQYDFRRNTVANRLSGAKSSDVQVVAIEATSTSKSQRSSAASADSKMLAMRASELTMKQRKQKHNLQKMVAIQSTLYVVSFAFCWVGPTTFHLIGWIANYQSFAFVLILVIFTPLQGFWNAIIYARPLYTRLREKEKHLTRWKALKRVFAVECGGNRDDSATRREWGGGELR
ncbi:hypothetical protein ACHAWF_001797 [Thalassiosira exigua]